MVVSQSMKSSATYLRRPIYIDPLVDFLLLADDWRTTSGDLDTGILLDSIVSWLNRDILKTLKRLPVGLTILDSNIHVSPRSRQRCATQISDPSGVRAPTPPLLAPDEESRFANYLPPDSRYAIPKSDGGNAYFAEIDEVLHLTAGEDRAQELQDILEEMQDELDAVSLDHPK
jgi:hypothetical protein